MIKKVNWEKAKEYTKDNIEWALAVVDDYFGDYETARKDNCLNERAIAFQEILRVIMPTAFNFETTLPMPPLQIPKPCPLPSPLIGPSPMGEPVRNKIGTPFHYPRYKTQNSPSNCENNTSQDKQTARIGDERQ